MAKIGRPTDEYIRPGRSVGRRVNNAVDRGHVVKLLADCRKPRRNQRHNSLVAPRTDVLANTATAAGHVTDARSGSHRTRG